MSREKHVTQRGCTYSFFGGINTGGNLEVLSDGLVLGCIDFIFGEDVKAQLDVEFLDADCSRGHDANADEWPPLNDDTFDCFDELID